MASRAVPRRGLGISSLAAVSLLVAAAVVLVLLAVASDGTRVRTPSRRSQARNQMLFLGQGLLRYADAHGALPPAALCDKAGKPLLSWRVLLLPFLEQEALYQEFDLDEPWDGPHNARLLGRMPRAYTPPDWAATAGPGTTFYRAFVGKGAAFEGPQGVRLEDFADGQANTILVVEATEAVPWTKPEGLPFAPGQPLPGLGHSLQERFLAALADGTALPLRRDVAEPTLRALVTRNGGEARPAGWDD